MNRLQMVLLLTVLLGASLHAMPAIVGVNVGLECCSGYMSKALRVTKLKSFRETSADCPRRAIVFMTESGKSACADPRMKWVQRAMKHLQKN
ncbi:C-C motif chemokine 17 [Rhinatrema bivittatum]|uniref:C-C motif chemokine 17 n=1 Tax=Rhinatrema bivittatum TaxID=194408 RepID=UPI001129469D|nr:C-C motif chemokine 17 [Rhinatrema bivittatum]